MDEAKPKRRWFRFSLRALLVVVTVLCVWIGLKVNAARRQHEAVTAILNAGGKVSFDYQWVHMPGGAPDDIFKDFDVLPPGPNWLRQLIGDEYFRDVFEVQFGDRFTESNLAQLPKLSAVKYVYFGSLEWKGVPKGPISPDQKGLPIGPVSQWPKGADVFVLEQLSHLQIVLFYNVDIDDSVLATLAKLRHLKGLILNNVPVDDTAMVEIGKMTNLEVLGLSGTRITDAGLKHIKNMKNLKTLLVLDTDISVAGLHYLDGLPKLEDVQASGPNLNPKEWQDFYQSLGKH